MIKARLMAATKTCLKKAGASVALCALLLLAQMAFATPSTTFWTPETLDIQPFGVVHLGIDNYFRTKFNPGDGQFPTDLTLPTIGVLPFQKVQMEIGVDYFATLAHPWLFNGKFGTPEGSFFKWQPAVEFGAYNVGKDFDDYFPGNPFGQPRIDYDIVYGVVGKSIPHIGRFSVGPYFVTNQDALISQSLFWRGDTASIDDLGWMIAFDHGMLPKKDEKGAVLYNRMVLAADYQSGDNALGAVGGGVYWYFTPNISLLVGPTVFNDSTINGRWKMTTQLDINLPKLGGWHRHHD